MIERKEYIERIKQKLDEWDDELERFEQNALKAGSDASEQWERHKLELQEMLLEMQERIDELRDEGLGMASVSQSELDRAWQQVSRDLELLTDRLFPAN